MRTRVRNAAVRRAGLALVLLIPFAIGSQRCMVGALGFGGAMRCLAIPTVQAAPDAHACCHSPVGESTATSKASGESDTPARGATAKSCCIEGAPVPASLAIDGAETSPTALVAGAPEILAAPGEPAPIFIAPDDSPPDALHGSPLHSRAPPRA